MLGIVVVLLISWGLLYFLERESLLALGLSPLPRRLKQFGAGFMITALLCTVVQGLEALTYSIEWQLNQQFDVRLLINRFWWDFKSVLTEELIFRGALLYILIQRLGRRRALPISAAAFGVYHWFSFGLLGQPIPMLAVFIGTGLMGYAWAVAFAKSHSIFMPLGLHLGWNFTFNTIFSKGPLGEGLLISVNSHLANGWFSLISLWVVPMLVLLVVKLWRPGDNQEAEAAL